MNYSSAYNVSTSTSPETLNPNMTPSVPVGINSGPVTSLNSNLILQPKVYIDGILYLPPNYNNLQYFSSSTIQSNWNNENRFLNISSQNCEQFRNKLLIGEHSINIELTQIKLPYIVYYYLNNTNPGKIVVTDSSKNNSSNHASGSAYYSQPSSPTTLILKNNNNTNQNFGKSINTLFIDINGKPFIYSNIISFDDVESVDTGLPQNTFVSSPTGSNSTNVSHIIHHFDMDFLNQYTGDSTCSTPYGVPSPAPAFTPAPAPAPAFAPAPAPASYPLNTNEFTIDDLRKMILNLMGSEPDTATAINKLTNYIRKLSDVYSSNPNKDNVEVYNLTVIFINYLNNGLNYLKMNDMTNAISNLNYALITDSKLYLKVIASVPVSVPAPTPAPASVPFNVTPSILFSSPIAVPVTYAPITSPVSSNLNVENLRMMISNLLGPKPDIPTAIYSLNIFIQEASSVYSTVPNKNNLELYNVIITFISLLNSALDDLKSNNIANAIKNLNSALSIDAALYVYLFSGNSYYYNNNTQQKMNNRPTLIANSLPSVIANLKSSSPDINGSINSIDTDMNLLVNDFRTIVANSPNNPLIPKINLMINNILFYCEKARLDLLSNPINIANAIHNLNNALYINGQMINFIKNGADNSVC